MLCLRRIEGGIPRQGTALFSPSLIFVEFLDGYPSRCSVGGGNGERSCGGNSHSRRSERGLGEKERELPADGFLRFSSVRVSWIWRIRLVCSPPRAPRLFSPLCSSFLLLSPSRAIRSREPRAERNERATCQSCQTDAASQPEEKLSGNEQEKDEKDEKDEEIERMYRRTDLLFVTRVCVNSSFVSLPCPPVYKRPDEGDDVLPSVTVHHLSSNVPASLVPLSLPSATEDDIAAAATAADAATAAPGK